MWLLRLVRVGMGGIIPILALQWDGSLLLLRLRPLAATWIAVAWEITADTVLAYDN